jgi:hypothetical protein
VGGQRSPDQAQSLQRLFELLQLHLPVRFVEQDLGLPLLGSTLGLPVQRGVGGLDLLRERLGRDVGDGCPLVRGQLVLEGSLELFLPVRVRAEAELEALRSEVTELRERLMALGSDLPGRAGHNLHEAWLAEPSTSWPNAQPRRVHSGLSVHEGHCPL